MRAHALPAVVEKLGTVLDLTVTHADKRLRIDDWKGWQLLTPVDAFKRTAGHGRLYLVKGALGDQVENADLLLESYGVTYEKWHKREAEKALALQHADQVGVLLGRVERIGYRSDKWGRRGKTHDYDHDFRERGGRMPKLWIDKKHASAATTAVITGGDFVVRQEGIC
jgi:hypothetical protein